MIFNNLDSIVRRTLLERSLPLQWYAEFLFHASAAVRELSFDTLKIINTVNLPINGYGAVDLPDDFVDDVGLLIGVGNQMQEIPKNYNLNPLRNTNTAGQFVPYTDVEESLSYVYGASPFWGWFYNINDWSEPTGRFFGAPGGTIQGYQVFKERRQIQLTDELASIGGIILQYISDGQRADNATQIDAQAIAAIQAYINWKSSGNAAIKDSYEASTYYNERRLLRARLNPVTKADLLNIMYNSFMQAPKN